MEKRLVYKVFIYTLCFSFLLLTSGFPIPNSNAKEKGLPIGEMVSKGEVIFEARENVWKKVEPSHFPVFQGVKIKTQKGLATIALGHHSRIEVSPNSLFCFDQVDRLSLSQGGIQFRISPDTELNFKVGTLWVTRSNSYQASQKPIIASPKNEETIGSISVHSNGSVTVRSTQGQLFILSQDHVVVAALSPKDSITIPSMTVKGSTPVIMAQAGETGGKSKGDDREKDHTWYYVAGGVMAAAGAGVGIWAISKKDGDHDYFPICLP